MREEVSVEDYFLVGVGGGVIYWDYLKNDQILIFLNKVF